VLWVKRVRVVALLMGAAMALPLAPAWAAPPSNDTFAGATVISSLPYSDIQDTTEATVDADDASLATVCSVDPTLTFSNSVWYAYTPSADQTVRIDTSGSSYSVAGAIVTGTPGAFSAVPGGCFIGGTTVALTAGITYYIDLLQFGAGSGGTLQLSISEAIPPDPVLTVDPAGSFSQTGTATLTGTASCAPGSSAFLEATLTQSVGRIATITGSGALFAEIVCDGTAHAWSITVTPFSGLFRGGKAIATVSLFACNAFTCDVAEATHEVQLRREH
jgi:hypothetical protein